MVELTVRTVSYSNPVPYCHVLMLFMVGRACFSFPLFWKMRSAQESVCIVVFKSWKKGKKRIFPLSPEKTFFSATKLFFSLFLFPEIGRSKLKAMMNGAKRGIISSYTFLQPIFFVLTYSRVCTQCFVTLFTYFLLLLPDQIKMTKCLILSPC